MKRPKPSKRAQSTISESVATGTTLDRDLHNHAAPRAPRAPRPASRGGERMFPGMDGRMYTEAEFRKVPYGLDWQNAQEARLRAAQRNPYFTFLEEVVGNTTPYYTMKDFDAHYGGDMRANIAATQEATRKMALDVMATKTKMFASLVGNMASDQKLRLGADAAGNVVVDSEQPANISMRDNMEMLLRAQMRDGDRTRPGLGDLLTNITRVVDSNIATVPEMPRLPFDASSIDWASDPLQSAHIRYTPVLKQGLRNLANTLARNLDFHVDAFDIPVYDNQGVRSIFAKMVAVEILEMGQFTVPKGAPPLVMEEIQMKKGACLVDLSQILGLYYHFGKPRMFAY